MGMDGRVRKAQLEEKVSESYARRSLKRADRAFATLYKNLYVVDPTKPAKYDIVINMDRLAVESAARIVSGAVTRSLKTYRAVQPQLQPA
jgi:cytidylate kinase